MFCCLRSEAQIDIGFQLSNFTIKNNFNKAKLLSANGFSTTFNIFKRLDKNVLLGTGFNSNFNKFVIDGIFFKRNAELVFEPNDNTIKNSYINFNSISVPLKFKFLLFETEKGSDLFINFGGYAEYLFSTEQNYKKFDVEKIEKIRLDRNTLFGLNIDYGMNFAITKERKILFANGFSYQLTSFLRNGNSFNPLNIYLKLAMTINTSKD